VLFVVGAFTVSWHQVNPAWLAAFILVALLLTGLVSKKDFQQKIDWPMIFFLLSLDGLQSLDQLPGARHRAECSSRQRFDFVGDNLLLFIPVALAVTLVLRLAMPITAGMVVAAVVLMPVATSQNIHPWVLTFLTAMLATCGSSPTRAPSACSSPPAATPTTSNGPGFRRYNHFINASRIVAAYASGPYWQWLGLA
jgi:divalent anion:Na+ symporter, DASS family